MGMQVLGVDIGGSGIKGAIVDTETGDFVGERKRIATPQPAKPMPIAEVVAQIAAHFGWGDAIGCTFPAVLQHGVTMTAANVHSDWIGTDAQAILARVSGNRVLVLNDADAAGMAEIRFGAGRDRGGLVVILTLGTGVGSAFFIDGKLIPNTEFGHLRIRGKSAEERTSDRGRKTRGYSWREWGARLSEHLQYIERLFTPDLFIIGGGVSKKYGKFFPHIQCQTEIQPAQLRNRAGIVGAALAAADLT